MIAQRGETEAVRRELRGLPYPELAARILALFAGDSFDIAELRRDGGIPEHVRTVIGILPQQRVLEIRVEGQSVEADPDRTTIREVTNALFKVASYHNIVALDPAAVHPTHPVRRYRRPTLQRYGGRGCRRRVTRYDAVRSART